MIPRGISKRYATALLRASLAKGIAGDVSADAKAFRRLLTENKSFRNFLHSPQVLTDNKKDLLKTALEGRASETFLTFLMLLIDKRRFFYVEEILVAYENLYEQEEGILEARVITAVPLDDGLREKVHDKLTQETKKKIRLVPEVDPEIIGGAIVVLGDKIIDGSIRYHLQKLKRELDQIRIS